MNINELTNIVYPNATTEQRAVYKFRVATSFCSNYCESLIKGELPKGGELEAFSAYREAVDIVHDVLGDDAPCTRVDPVAMVFYMDQFGLVGEERKAAVALSYGQVRAKLAKKGQALFAR